jgi:hypothetical protein
VTAARTLEGRYRRLLAVYPAGHRRKHQDEMLGVLMTGAHAGQRWPGLRESVDLIVGALRIRLRPPHDDARQGWADALAVTSVVVPILVLAYIVTWNVAMLATMPKGIALLGAALVSFSVSTAAWAILAALVLLRLRRLAGLAATGLLGWLAVSVSAATGWDYVDPQSMILLVPLALEAAALLASPGPRRGMQLMTWKRYALAVAAPAALASARAWQWPGHPAVYEALAIAVIAVILAGMILASPLTRRLASLLWVPAYFVVVGFLVPPLFETGPSGTGAVWDGSLRIAVTCVPFAVTLGVLLAAALRAVRRAPAGGREA